MKAFRSFIDLRWFRSPIGAVGVIVTAVAEKLSALRTAEFFEERRQRADVDAALATMTRARGDKPRAGDEA